MSQSEMPASQCVCHECGLVLRVENLNEGQKACCPRCGYVISRFHKNAVDRILIFSLTAFLLLFISGLFDFIRINAQGLVREMTLGESIATLFLQGEWLLASFLLVFIVLIPIVLLASMIFLSLLIKFNNESRNIFILLRIIESIRFWNMLEIFFLGVLVSMIKVISLADIFLGVSFWSCGLFSVFLIAATNHVDKFQVAKTVHEVNKNQGDK